MPNEKELQKEVPCIEIPVPAHEHESNPESMIEHIADATGKTINTEFPLSGGETDADLQKSLSSEHEPHHESLFEQLVEDATESINTVFPLSGGATEADLK